MIDATCEISKKNLFEMLAMKNALVAINLLYRGYRENALAKCTMYQNGPPCLC
jgi:hypothetical protein